MYQVSVFFFIINLTQKMDLRNSVDNPTEVKPETTKLSNYKITETLGSGTFGKVKAAIHIPSGQKVGIKIIDKKTLKDQDDLDRVQRQVEIMKVARHPNIIQFYEKIQTQQQIFLVLEFVQNGELFKLMSDEGRLNQRAAGRIFIQLLNAVEYLHRLGIAHRDLKPENILLDTDYNIKLIDFGLSNYSQKGQFLLTACGSPCYAPPQMVSGNSYEGQIGDIWSMGIIFYGMICGSLPFQQNTTKQLYKKVIQGFYVIPSDISLQATQVIRKMLVTNPTKRITIPELRKLQFFRNLRQVEPKIIGLIVGFHPMPIDSEIVQKMLKIVQFDRQKVEDQIKQNENTQFTTLYYLLQKKSLRSGGKTVVDLQYFLQSSQRYKSEYGILPQEFKDQLQTTPRQGSTETIKTIKNAKAKDKYTINNTKGLSKQKRQPIMVNKRVKTQNVVNHTYRSEKQQKIQKPQQLFNTIRKYKFQKSNKIGETVELKHQSASRQRERSRQMKTLGSQQKNKQRSNRSKQSQQGSSSKSRKKSQRKVRDKNTNKLALNLWNAYFQKTIQINSKVNKVPSSGRINVKLKQKQKQADKVFNQNLQKLKQGFLKLPFMKKNKNEEPKTQQKNQQNKTTKKSIN